MAQASPHERKVSFSHPSSWHVDIDRFINPVIPAPRWHLLPGPLAYMLGHRHTPQKPLGNVLVALWSMVGAFCSVALISEITKRVPAFESRDVPTIVGSFGAAAVLEFCAIESPFAQPRNALFSQVFACVIGVGISKLFALNPYAEEFSSLGGALACGITTAVMALTNTVHPPAGATSLLAVTNAQTSGLGWWLIPVMLLGIALMQAAALIINNIQRRYPLYWWTSHSLAPRPRPEDLEKTHQKEDEVSIPSNYEESLTDEPRRLVVARDEVHVPDGVFLSVQERRLLQELSERL